jgi:anti-sigma B factor antagonist
MNPFDFSFESFPGICVFSLKGSLMDKQTAQPMLDEADRCLGNGMINFVVDLSDFVYLNSSGLGVLISLLTRARNHGGEVIICCIPDRIKELLVMTKLHSVFQLQPNRSTALAAFGVN